MKPSKIRAIFALTLVLAMLTLGVRSFAASSPAKVSLDLKFAELAEVFRVLAQVGGSNIVVSPSVSGKITVKLTSVPVEEALDIICSVSDLEYIYMNGTIMIGPKGTVSKLMDKAVVEKIELLNISATDAATKLSFAIPGIAAQPDDKSGTLLIRGNQSDITLAKAFLVKVDAPLPVTKMTVAEEEVIDIIQLSNAEAKGVYDAVSKLLKASLAVDARLNAILAGGKITDVKAARSIIEKLDIAKKAEVSTQPVEIRVIQLTNAAATDVKAVASLIIPADRIQSDAKSNTLIIKATPEEHTKVSDLVKNIEAATPKAAAVAEVKEKLEVITLLYAKATDVAEALTVVLPANKIAIDERTNKIVMLVDAAQGAEALALIKELDVKVADVAVAAVAAPILRLGYYSPVHAKAQDIEAVVKLAASGAKLQVIESNNSLVAYGTESDHALIAEALKKLDEEALAVKNAAVKQPAVAMEVVELKHAKAADVQKALASVLPAENVTIDERTNKVLLKVTPSEKLMAMEIIGAVDVKVDQPTAIAVAPSLEVMTLKYASAAEAKKVLDGVLGAAKVNIDERTNKVVILGTPDERALAAQIIQNLDIEMASLTPKPAVSSLEVFQLKYAQAAEVQKALAAVVEPSGISIDERTNKVIILGTPDERSLAAQIIQNMDIEIVSSAPKPAVSSLEVVLLKYAQAAEVQKALAAVLAPSSISIDERTNKLLLKVTPEEKQLAMAVINELDVRIDAVVAPVEVENLEIVELKFAKASDAKQSLDAALGQGKVSIDERSNKILMIVTPHKKQLAMSIISAIDVPIVQAVVQTVEPALEMVQLQYADASDVKKILDGVLGAANVSIDERTNKLLLKVTPDEKRLAMAVINELDVKVDTAAAPVEVENLEVVELKYAKAIDTKPALEAALGQGKVSIDERSNKVLMIVTQLKKQLALNIISAIDVPIAQAVAQTVEPTVEMVQLKYAVAADVKKVLDGILGAANINTDERTNKVILKVTPAGKAVAMDIIRNLDVEVAPKVQLVVEPTAGVESLQIVQLKYAPAIEVGKALEAVISAEKVNVDARTNKIIMNVTDEEFSKAQAIIAALDIRLDGELAVTSETVQMGFYKLYNVKPSDIEASVKVVAGEAKVQAADQTSSITAYGTSMQLKMIESLIAKLDVVPTAKGAVAASVMETLEVVQLTNASAADVRASLSVLLPESKVSINERTNKVMMIVTPELKARAMTVISALDVPVAQAAVQLSDPVRLGFFQLKYASAKDMEAPVKLVASAAKVQVAERTNSMIVYGTESELALIGEVISKLDVEVKTPEDISAALAEYKTYKLNNASPTEISSALTILLPASSMLPDDRSGTLIIKAVPETQKLAADVIATLDVKSVTQASVDADMSVTRVYKLNHAEPADLKAALAEVTTGKVSIDTRTSSLVVTAKASEQAQLVEIIDQLDQELAQVFFEASLYELSGDASKRLGIDWTINKLVFGYNTLSQLATVSLDFDNKIAALANEGKAKLISKQHTFTVDGKAGRMLIGDRIPVIVQNVDQGQVVNTVNYINAGIELSILPKVSYDGSITAEVKPIISSIIGWTPQNYPQIRTRELETIVTVKNGESAIIGGLFSQEEIETITKVPILGDIPLIKELFTKRGTDTKDQEIIIVITAWTIKPGQTTGLKDGIVEIKGPVL